MHRFRFFFLPLFFVAVTCVFAPPAAAGELVGPSPSRSAPPVAEPDEAPPVPLDGLALRRAIRAGLPAVKACYERSLKQGTERTGRMVVSWTVSADGSVTDARVQEDEIGAPRLQSCVVDVVAGWRFPRGTEDVEVEYPLRFGSKGSRLAATAPQDR